MTAKIRFINPEALVKPPSYTQVVEVTGPGRTVFIAGQLGTDRNGEVVGEAGDFRVQAVQVFENLKAALAAVGAQFDDVVKLNSYLADIKYLPILREVRAGYLNADALPASTTISVAGFARPTALLEIEAVAALPLPSAPTRGARAKPSPASAQRARGGVRSAKKVRRAKQKRK